MSEMEIETVRTQKETGDAVKESESNSIDNRIKTPPKLTRKRKTKLEMQKEDMNILNINNFGQEEENSG